MDMRATGQLRTRASIDHVCLSDGLVKSAKIRVQAWEGTTDDGVKASDHNGVEVDVTVQ